MSSVQTILQKSFHLVVGTFVSSVLIITSWYTYTLCTIQVGSTLVGTIQVLAFFDLTIRR